MVLQESKLHAVVIDVDLNILSNIAQCLRACSIYITASEEVTVTFAAILLL